jgi:2'-5' RNA ligase
MAGEKKEPHLFRSILIFPEFANIHELDEVRKVYDPAYTTIRPHVTLVFPFCSAYTANEISRKTVLALHDVQPFKLSFHRLRVIKSYICMIPDTGHQETLQLFQQLYTEQFSAYLPDFLRQEDFIPHMTIGKCTPGTAAAYLEDIQKKISVYETTIETISIEIIGLENKSIIESEIALRGYVVNSYPFTPR